MKTYVVGGLLLVLVTLLDVWRAVFARWLVADSSLAEMSAMAVYFPIAISLGTFAVLLGCLQRYLAFSQRFEIAVAAMYLAGAAILSVGLYRAALMPGLWELGALNPVTTTGLVLRWNSQANLIRPMPRTSEESCRSDSLGRGPALALQGGHECQQRSCLPAASRSL